MNWKTSAGKVKTIVVVISLLWAMYGVILSTNWILDNYWPRNKYAILLMILLSMGFGIILCFGIISSAIESLDLAVH